MQTELLHLPRISMHWPRPRLGKLVDRMLGWLRDRAERRSLARLDDRTLRDVGLSRADIDREYEQPFWAPIDVAALEMVRRRSGPRLGRAAGD